MLETTNLEETNIIL